MTRFRNFLILGGLWIAVGFVIPEAARGVSYAIGSTAVLIFVYRASRSFTPEIRGIVNLVVIGGALSSGGAIIRGIQAALTGEEFPIPSVGDLVTLPAYIFLVWAITKIVRQRVGTISLDLAIDALVAAAAGAVVQWSVLMAPIVSNSEVLLGEKIVQSLYAVAGLAFLWSATMLLVAGSHKSTSNRLLGTALILTFISDNLGTAMTVGGGSESIVLYIAPAMYVFAGAGILHPSIRLITSRPTDAQALRGISTKRIGVMALVLITPPTVVVAFLLAQKPERLMLAAAGSLMLAPLVVLRLARLVRDREHLAEQESILRSVSEELVVASSTQDIVSSVKRGTVALVGSRLTRLKLQIPVKPADTLTTVEGRTLNQVIADATASATLRAGTLVQLASAENCVAGLIVVTGECRGLLVVGSTKRFDGSMSNALSALCREAAIAIRAVEQTEQSVRERSEERFESLIRNSSDILAVLNTSLQLSYVSSVAERLLGYPVSSVSLSELNRMQTSRNSPESQTGTVLDLIHRDDRAAGASWLESIAAGNPEPIEVRIQHFQGNYSWFELMGVDLTHDSNVGGIVLNARQVNDRKQAEAQLQISEARFKALVQNSSDLVVVVDVEGTITYASPSVAPAVHLPTDEVVGAQFGEVFFEHDLSRQFFAESPRVATGELIEFRFTDAAGAYHIVETTITDLRDQPEIGGFVLNAREVTDRRAMEQRLLYQANHDELTGLSNRNHALAELSSTLSKSAGATTVALLLLDIDDLKDVNDSLGHEVGDHLLRELSDRLRDTLTFGDIAARIAGDEFVVIVERSHGEEQIMDLTYDLLDRIAEPFHVQGREISISVSAGIAFDHDRSNTSELMLRNADTAMYRAKERGRNEVAVFEPHMHTATFDRLELRADLARAVAHNQFEAFYQPIVDIESNRIVGAEALVRWRHPQRGLVGPNIFIPLAEETGLINAIGEWMIARASVDLASWITNFGQSMDDFTISVNLSPYQLRNESLVNSVERILRDAGLPPERLVLEITESTLVTESGGAVEMMRDLRERGIKLSIDDFGTGYSSLGYIQQFEFDVLKIDKSFIDDVHRETNKRIVKTIIELAKNLNVKTVAEGIEQQSQIGILSELGCPLGQGYVFSRPVPAVEFRGLLGHQVLLPSSNGNAH